MAGRALSVSAIQGRRVVPKRQLVRRVYQLHNQALFPEPKYFSSRDMRNIDLVGQNIRGQFVSGKLLIGTAIDPSGGLSASYGSTPGIVRPGAICTLGCNADGTQV